MHSLVESRTWNLKTKLRVSIVRVLYYSPISWIPGSWKNSRTLRGSSYREELAEPIGLIDRLLTANRTANSLEALRTVARTGEKNDLTLEDGLLLYQNRLIVPDTDNLRTDLIKEAHEQVSTAHPGRRKTVQLLANRYYWKGLTASVERFIRNCHACRRANAPRDRTPGLLHPLPVPQRPWQHVTMDFQSFPQRRTDTTLSSSSSID